MARDATTYANDPAGKKTAHAYEIECVRPNGHPLAEATTFTVYANNRTQAAARVKLDGWVVCSVNMVG